MACNTLIGIEKDCLGNAGGVSRIWLNNGDAIDMSTVTYDTETQEVTAATLAGGTGGTPFVEFQFNPNVSSFVENIAVDLTTNSTFYDQTITLQLSRREAVKRQRLLLIADGQPPLTMIVKDANENYWVFGLREDKMYLSGSEGGSGTAKTDLNGYILTFTAQSAFPAFAIDEDVVETLGTSPA